MIRLMCVDGHRIAVNGELIESVESTPETVVTLVGGARFVVVEDVDEVLEAVRAFRASVAVLSSELEATLSVQPRLRLVTDPDPQA